MPFFPQDDVEIKTIDGLTLHGWLYPASVPDGPGIIITCGFNMPKDLLAPQIAKWFQRKGVTALVYDNRGIGSSDGEPRNDIDPQAQVSDLHDAVTFLSAHPLVKMSKITLWGLSLSGAVVLSTASLDPRVGAVISLAPTAQLSISSTKRMDILNSAMADRVARTTKQASPLYTPMASETDGSNLGGLPIDPLVVKELEKASPNFRNAFTVQTGYKLLAWQVGETELSRIACPVLVVAPEGDVITPVERQRKEVFQHLRSDGSKFEVIKVKGHWDWWEGEGFDGVLGVQLAWMQRVLKIL